MGICDKCNKHQATFKDMEANEKICLLCGIKKQYKIGGIKKALKTIKYHFKCQWVFTWKDEIVDFLSYLILVFLTLYSIYCFFIVILEGEYEFLLNSIISLCAMFYLWKN